MADALTTPRADLAAALVHDYQIHYNQPPKRLYDMLVTPIDALATQPFGERIRTERQARELPSATCATCRHCRRTRSGRSKPTIFRAVAGKAGRAQQPDVQSTVDLVCSEAPMTRGDAADLRLRYEAGATPEQLAADTGHSHRCVRETLLAAGTTLRPARRRVPPCPPGMVAMHENGATIRQVVQRYGLSYGRARNMLLHAGVVLRPQGQARAGSR